MKRLLVTISLLAMFVVATTAGCDRGVPEDQLGEIQYTVPNLPGTEEPYPLPEPKLGRQTDEAEGSAAEGGDATKADTEKAAPEAPK